MSSNNKQVICVQVLVRKFVHNLTDGFWKPRKRATKIAMRVSVAAAKKVSFRME